MHSLLWVAVVSAWGLSVAGTIELCGAIERRNQIETQRELLGVPPGKAPWP